ncbi:toprim domain-containing protein [Actinosynnema sp. CA-299493]
MTVSEDIPRMFNVRAVHGAGDEIHVCEGELDAVILSMLGLHAVAIPGAKLWFGRHRRMLAGFSRVWVWGDPDDAGAEFVAKVTRSLRSAKGVRLRTGDVTETYLAGGREAIFEPIKPKELTAA